MRPLSLKGHERALTRVRLNQQGDILFSSSKDKSICVWYTDNGERIGTYDGHNGVIWDVDVTWDTKTLVSASGDQSVKIWDVETGICQGTVELKNVARSIALSYSGNLCAFTTQGRLSKEQSAQNEPILHVFDMREQPKFAENGTNFVINQQLGASCEACLFSHLDDTIVVGTEKGHLNLFDLRSPGDARDFSMPHNYAIRDLQLSVDQGFIISSSADKTAQLHNAKNLEQLKKYKSSRPVNSASISPSRDHIVLGGGEESMKVTQTATSSGQFEAKVYHLIYEEEFARFKGHFGPINSLVYNPAGTVVVSGGEDGYIRIQELDQSYLDFEFDY
jgi:translation initiation factor 3 subunit I